VSGGAWFSLGVASGIALLASLNGYLDRLDATAATYIRLAGSPTVTRRERR
jgi:hypothetical protein